MLKLRKVITLLHNFSGSGETMQNDRCGTVDEIGNIREGEKEVVVRQDNL